MKRLEDINLSACVKHVEGSLLPDTADPRSTPRNVQVMLLTAMAVWGINLSAVKALTGMLDVMLVATSRMVVAVAMLSGLLLLRRAGLPRIAPRQIASLAFCAVLMVYCNQVLFSSALTRTSATHAALILALNPLLSALFAAVALREPLGARRLAGISIGFAGVAAVILNRPQADFAGGLVGDLLFLASVVCFASGGFAVQRLSRGLAPLDISWVVHVIGTAMLVVHTLAFDPGSIASLASLGAAGWGLILFSGIMATALAAVVWNRAIAHVGAARTAMALYWVPIFGVLFAVTFLGEPLSWWHAVGLGAVVAGSLLSANRVR